MALITGTIKLAGAISPTDTTDTYASHIDIYGKGGIHSVGTLAEMSAITTDRRSEGMMAYVTGNSLTYQLQGGIDNANWQLFSGAGATSGVHNDLSGIQGGTSAEYYHLTSSDYSTLRGGASNADSLHLHAFSALQNTGHTHTEFGDWNYLDTGLDTHTGTSNIHFTEASIDFANITNTGHTHLYSTLLSTGHSHAISDVTNLQTSLDAKADQSEYASHTGTSTIHFTEGSIDFGNISSTGHSHEYSEIFNTGHTHSEFGDWTYLDGNLSTHTGTSNIHFTESSIDIDNIVSGHSHAISDVTNLQTELDGRTTDAEFTTHTGTSTIHFTEGSIDIDNIVSGHTHPSDELTYTNLTATEVAHGGWPIGSTFNNVTFKALMDGILYPYQTPSFASFYIDGASAAYEVGQTALAGSFDFVWVFNNDQNVSGGTLDIYDITDTTQLYEDVSTGSPQNHNFGAGITKTTATSHQWRAMAKDTQDTEFTSATRTINWQWARYYGSGGTSITASEVTGLTTQLGTSYANASTGYDMEASNYKWLAYPDSWGEATEFTDKNTMLEVPMSGSYTMSVTNQYGESTTYRLHRTLNSLGGAITILVS